MIIRRIEWIFWMFAMINGQLFDNKTMNIDNQTEASRRTNQITTILDRLLKDYDAQIRPNLGGTEKCFSTKASRRVIFRWTNKNSI